MCIYIDIYIHIYICIHILYIVYSYLEKDEDSIKNTWAIRGNHPILWSIPHLL